MKSEVTIQVVDLDDIRSILAAVRQYLLAEDIAQSQRSLQAKVNHSPLTREVSRLVDRVDNVMKDNLLILHDRDEPQQEQLFDPDTLEVTEAAKP